MKEPRILEETRSWLVVDKPAGLPVHATNLDEPDLLTLLGGKRHAVHRLDRDTSGLVLIANNKETAARLMALWGTPSVRKFYRAVVRGSPTWDLAEWTHPLSERAEGHRDPAGPKNAWKDCHTKVRVLQRHPQGTLLECEILTGRKHQIRRHAALAGFPLLGDERYGGPRSLRLALHSYRLSLNWQGLPFEWECPPPEDFPKSP